MVSDLKIALNGVAFVGVFGVQIAKHIERCDITRVVIDDRAIFGDRRADLTLRDVTLSTPHRFCFVEIHYRVTVAPAELDAGDGLEGENAQAKSETNPYH